MGPFLDRYVACPGLALLTIELKNEKLESSERRSQSSIVKGFVDCMINPER